MDDELPEEYQDYEVGSIEDAQVPDETERVYITDDEEGLVWWFDIKDVTWEKKNQVLSDSVQQDPDTKEGRLRAEQYYRQMFMAMVVDSSVEEGLLATFLTGLRADLGEQLEDHVPDPIPVQHGSEDEEGNSETRSSSQEENSGEPVTPTSS